MRPKASKSGGDGEEGGEGEEEEEISPMCESIGHWPLWGRCPKRTNAICMMELKSLLILL